MGGPSPTVPVLVGPTAVGKTEVAVRLAEWMPITVISADSRQVYKKLDIGTAKPTTRQLSVVPHLGIDLVEPGETYSAGRFAADAASWIQTMQQGRQAMVVGGTGFYVRALSDGLFREPPLDHSRRDRLRAWIHGADGLGRWARRLDSEFSGGGRQRAGRVIEMALLTGRSLSWWQREAKAESIMRPWYVRLTAPRAVLHRRIDQRVDVMLEQGFVEEVEEVLARGIPGDAPGLDAVGYREIVRHLNGDLREADLADAISQSTRRYAKRQETWFRHQLGSGPVLVLDTTADPDEAAERIALGWREREE